MTPTLTTVSPNSLTRLAGLRRWQALTIAALAAGVVAWCLWVVLTQETIPSGQSDSGQGETTGDADFYRVIVGRVHAGHGYYDSVAEELRNRGYEPHSMFNWRPPLYAWLHGIPPSPGFGQALLFAGVLATVYAAYRLVQRTGGALRAGVCAALMVGAFAWCGFPDIALFTELWAGMLIALSVCAYGSGRWGLGVVTGLVALCFRELALPYCVISFALACRQRRSAEAACWLAGFALYAIFLTLHGAETARRITSPEGIGAASWVQFGGTAFVLLTTQINFFLLILLPAWVAAVYLPLGLLGLLAWRHAVGVRAGLTVLTYAAAFMVIGTKPHNAYWGLLYAPLLPLGLVWAPDALRDLFRAAVRPFAPTQPTAVPLASCHAETVCSA